MSISFFFGNDLFGLRHDSKNQLTEAERLLHRPGSESKPFTTTVEGGMASLTQMEISTSNVITLHENLVLEHSK